jgi:type IV secretion system protein TrbL
VLAALSLLGLGIFGPGVATGLAAGAPQLGAGAAVGTALTAAGVGVAAPTAVWSGGRLAFRGGRGAYRGVSSVVTGQAFSSNSGGSGGSAGSSSPPAWARRMRRQQTIAQGVSTAAQTIRSGDHGGGSTSVNLREEDR